MLPRRHERERQAPPGSARAALLGLVSAGVALLAVGPLRADEPTAPRSQTVRAVPRVPPPLAANIRTVEVVDEGTVVYREPVERSSRRGTLARGTRVRVLGRVFGTGCSSGSPWIQIEEHGFVCESGVRFSTEEAVGVPQPVMREPGSILPNSYAFVTADATPAYAHPQDYEIDEYSMTLGHGFGLVIRGRRTVNGVSFAQTRGGLWVPTDVLRFARGSDFVGVELTAGVIDVGWTRRPNVSIRHGRESRRAGRREPVRIVGEERRGQMLLLDGGESVSARDIVRPTLSSPPADVIGNERWIDIEIATQTLVAYEGARPVFATLVSTGRAGPSTATPVGEFRIWGKLATSDMDDIEREDVDRNYAIENVPWVQFFAGENALHAAFWHDDFGTRRSHGCVNLSPRDARRLFEFTTPALPAGWVALLLNAEERPTIVRIR